MVPYGLTYHWFAVSVSLKAASADDHGPGLWRLQAPHAGGEGVRNIISAILDSQANCPDQGPERLVTNLPASMRAHVAEERKRVKVTMVDLELKVEELRWKVMSDPSSQALYEDLIKNEAALKLYQDSNKERLQVLKGLLQELVGESPSGTLSGLVKSRKAKTKIAELTFKGVLRKGASEVLQAASEHFREAYALSPLSSPVEPWPIEEGKALQESDRLQLDSEWSEQEVKPALKGLPAGKAPGQDGLPKEFFERNWELLGPAVMREVRTFESAGVLSESFTTAVTILLHKKGDRDDLGNYRPITLLSFFYKLLAKVLANRIKVVLPRVISSNQFGFLPGRSLADAVSLVADAIDAAEQEDEDWLLLLVDFHKAYDSVSREYLFTTLGNMGFPGKFTRWVKGLHDGAATKVLLNGWIGERVVMAKGHRIDTMVIQGLGKALAEQEPLRNWLRERAAAFPLGLAMIYAHHSVLKSWLGGGMRWKATIKALWDSKLVTIGDSAHRWDAEEEQLLFNRSIFFRGRSPLGNQAGSLCLKGVRLGDLVAKGGDGSRSRKSDEVLERELGGVEQRKWALKAWDATPQGWKDLVLKQLSAEELFRETRLVRSASYRPGEFFYYQLQYVSNGEVYGRRVTVDKKGNIGEVEYACVVTVEF
ncbi:unnamed protein product [Closterium sp. NIES-65]|nr:unnamed protein product [Closterium sp. NIES-65]